MVRIDIEIGAASGREDGVEERGEAAVKRHRGDLRFRIGGFDRLVNGLHDRTKSAWLPFHAYGRSGSFQISQYLM